MPPTNAFEKKVLGSIPLSVYQKLFPKTAIGLAYHAVSPEAPTYLKHIYPIKDPQAFEQDLIFLKDRFNLISYSQLEAHLAGETLVTSNSVLLTFDDGYRECFSIVRPLLLKHKVPCTFFLTTGLLDNGTWFYRNKYSLGVEAYLSLPADQTQALLAEINEKWGLNLPDPSACLQWLRSLKPPQEDRLDWFCARLGVDLDSLLQQRRPYLTSAEARQLAADGFTLGAHSISHKKFRFEPEERIQEEILGSCQAVKSLSGGDRVPFAFPFSGFGVSRQFLARLIAENPLIGLIFDVQGLRPEPPFVINRIWVDPPPESPDTGSNLGDLLHRAYQEYANWRRRYYQSVLRARLKGQGG